MVKLYPAVLGLAFVAALGLRKRMPIARFIGAAAAVVAVGYLPHVAAVGLRVVGYLPGYLTEEKYGEGGRYLLAGLLGLPAGLTAAVAAAGVAGVAGWVLLRRPDVPRGCAALIGGLLLAVTPVQPWYAVTLLAVAAVAAAPRWSAVALAGYPYFFALLLDSPHTVAIGRVSYGVALVVVVAAGRRRAPPQESPGTRVTGEAQVA
jgi:hypothetical protein